MFALLGSALQTAVTAPHRLFCSTVHPYLPAVRLSALLAVHDIGQHIPGAGFSPDGDSLLVCWVVDLDPACPLLLHLVKQLPQDNRFMVSFLIPGVPKELLSTIPNVLPCHSLQYFLLLRQLYDLQSDRFGHTAIQYPGNDGM